MTDTYIVLDPKKLKKAREDAGLSIQDVAIELELSEQQIRHFETGYARPLADTLLTICRLYKINNTEILVSEVSNPTVFHLRKKC